MTNLEEMSNASSDTGYNRIPPNYSDRLSRSRREISFRSGIDIETEMTISFLDACKGGKKNIEVNKKEFCTVCTGSGKNFDVCPDCKGTSIEKTVRKGIFGKENIPCQKCGGSRKIAVSSCPRCKGSGSTEALCTVELNIPAGIDDGQTLVVRGQGNADVIGRLFGRSLYSDLYVHIKVPEHPVFRREGFDITTVTPVGYEKCRQGGEIVVPTIDGEVRFTIPKDAKYGTLFRLKGKGIRKLGREERGDQYVRIVPDDAPANTE